MNEKEKLQKTISEGNDARRKLHDIENKENAERNLPLVGRCFKYRNNYGASSEGWWLYSEILSVDGAHFEYLTFQECEGGKIIIETREFGYDSLQQTEITKQEYDKEFRLLLDKLESLYQGN